MAQIEIDYQDTIRKASRLETLARELRTVGTKDLQNLQSGVGRSWCGSAAEMYKKRTSTFSRQVESQARQLESMARSLRQSAERYRRLEELANSIFS